MLFIIFLEEKFGGYRNSLYLCTKEQNTDTIMLGIESPRKPITGSFAKELREALVRARTGKLNQSEKESILHSRSVSKKYNAIWR